jgi:hypothetical protein
MQSRPRMSNWHDPFHLIGVGVRAGLSAIFGDFVDRRDAEAAVRPLDPDEPKRVFAYNVGNKSAHGEQLLDGRKEPVAVADCESDGSFWFDYMADTGDGWNQTYAMARLPNRHRWPVRLVSDNGKCVRHVPEHVSASTSVPAVGARGDELCLDFGTR